MELRLHCNFLGILCDKQLLKVESFDCSTIARNIGITGITAISNNLKVKLLQLMSSKEFARELETARNSNLRASKRRPARKGQAQCCRAV